MLIRTPSAVAAFAVLGFTATLPQAVAGQNADNEIRAVIHAFHDALAAGDSTAALSRLADDVVILEGGGIEDKDHYRSGHLAGDMRFAQAVPATRGEISITQVGDVAWAWSTSTREGRMGDREIDSRGADLVVLRRDGGRWLITAIHWSSRSN